MKRKVFLTLLVLVALLAVAGYTVMPWRTNVASAATQTGTTAPLSTVSNVPQFAGPADMEAAFENIYNQVNPSVVLINVVEQPTSSTLPGFGNSPFGSPFQQGPQGRQTAPAQTALGSGFVWNTDGYIVTNNHVISGASKISVVFSDGTTVPATVVGADPDSDLAVLKVNAPASELHPVQVADSTQVKVGQLAIAIGNPFGEHNTMTTGIISALGRSLPVNQSSTSQGASYTIPDVIQTDAPINPGNSGGVLLNIDGQVIGVTSEIESPVRASSGVGFAIPSEIVQKVVPALIKTGHYDHPYLGLSGTTLTPSLAQAMGLNASQRGALVIDVTAGGPADKAGLHGSTQQATVDGQQVPVGGDVITAIDSQSVKSFDDIVAYLARSTNVGQTVTLTILRGGQQQTIQVTLTARPASQSALSSTNVNS